MLVIYGSETQVSFIWRITFRTDYLYGQLFDLAYYEKLSVTIRSSRWRYSFFQIRICLWWSLFFLPKFFLDHNSVYLYWQMLCVETVELFRTAIISERKKIIVVDLYWQWLYQAISCHWSLPIPPENIKKLQVQWFFLGVQKQTSGIKWVNKTLAILQKHWRVTEEYRKGKTLDIASVWTQISKTWHPSPASRLTERSLFSINFKNY